MSLSLQVSSDLFQRRCFSYCNYAVAIKYNMLRKCGVQIKIQTLEVDCLDLNPAISSLPAARP